MIIYYLQYLVLSFNFWRERWTFECLKTALDNFLILVYRPVNTELSLSGVNNMPLCTIELGT